MLSLEIACVENVTQEFNYGGKWRCKASFLWGTSVYVFRHKLSPSERLMRAGAIILSEPMFDDDMRPLRLAALSGRIFGSSARLGIRPIREPN